MSITNELEKTLKLLDEYGLLSKTLKMLPKIVGTVATPENLKAIAEGLAKGAKG